MIEKLIREKKAVIGVIGLGYVGLPLVRLFIEKGFPAYGFDIDSKKPGMLRAGKSYIKHIDFSFFKSVCRSGKFVPTSDFKLLKKTDAVIICVPTPIDERKEPDLSPVVKTGETVSKYLHKGQLIVLESTTYPGTTREVLLPILERSGLKAEKDFYLAFSPEREDPGNKKFNTKNIPKVVGGYGRISRELAAQLYGSVVDRVIPVSSCEAAEATKMLENTFRAVNIALVNELKILFQRMGIDIWEVVNTCATKPFGYMPFYPGPGWGGHCIPVDPYYLVWKAKEYDIPLKFIELAGEVNTMMPEYVVEVVSEALNRQKKSIKGSSILILGVAYKRDIDDVRESPALIVMDILEKKGADLKYFDPYVKKLSSHRHKREMKSEKELKPALRSADCVVILTDHTGIDYDAVFKASKLIVDTRNAIKGSNKTNKKVLIA